MVFTVLFSLLLLHQPYQVLCWTTSSTNVPRRRTRTFQQLQSKNNNIIDAELESNDDATAPIKNGAQQPPKSFLEASLQADPEMSNIRVPFLKLYDSDGTATECIDCKLAFCVSLDGVDYGIGVPFDPAVAIIYQQDELQHYINPDDSDNDEYAELCEIMAQQLQEQLSKDLQLVKTPRVLTVVGDLDKYIGNWKTDLIPPAIPAHELAQTDDFDDDEEELKAFHDFMRKELGEEEYQKTLNEEPDESIIGMLDLFEQGAQLENPMDPTSDYEKMQKEFGLDNLERDALGLKLVSYVFTRKSKSYSLIKLFRPVVLFARKESDDKGTRFCLLPPDEEKLILPKLAKVCQDDLQQAGLELQP